MSKIRPFKGGWPAVTSFGTGQVALTVRIESGMIAVTGRIVSTPLSPDQAECLGNALLVHAARERPMETNTDVA